MYKELNSIDSIFREGENSYGIGRKKITHTFRFNQLNTESFK